jgi:hypothetical protein
METILRDEAHTRIRHLGLPEVVLTAFEGRAVPEVLQRRMRDPYELFVEPTRHGGYPLGRIIPLWSDHTGYTIVGYRESEPRGFLRFRLEGDGRAPDIEGVTFQQIVVHDLVQIWEAEDDEDAADAALREAADLLGFVHGERLIEAMRDPMRIDDFDVWERAFVQVVGVWS